MSFFFGTDPLPLEQLPTLEAQCQRVWDTRELVTGRAGCELEPAVEEQIKEDLVDLAMLWADMHLRAAGNRLEEARLDALRLLREAESLLEVDSILARECQEHAQALGQTDPNPGAVRPPQTARGHYSFGRLLMLSGNRAQAIAEFESALDLQPQNFWPNFYRGTCAYRLGRYGDAVNAFRACLALAPDSAECFYNRALAQAALGRSEQALHDYSYALKLDPTLAAAALNRGILHYEGKRYNEALDDLKRARDNGADSATVDYNMALVYVARKDRSAALRSLRRVFEDDRQHKEARELYNRLIRER
jgi:tetratricopeptide (TPR) repeat protein